MEVATGFQVGTVRGVILWVMFARRVWVIVFFYFPFGVSVIKGRVSRRVVPFAGCLGLLAVGLGAAPSSAGALVPPPYVQVGGNNCNADRQVENADGTRSSVRVAIADGVVQSTYVFPPNSVHPYWQNYTVTVAYLGTGANAPLVQTVSDDSEPDGIAPVGDARGLPSSTGLNKLNAPPTGQVWVAGVNGGFHYTNNYADNKTSSEPVGAFYHNGKLVNSALPGLAGPGQVGIGVNGLPLITTNTTFAGHVSLGKKALPYVGYNPGIGRARTGTLKATDGLIVVPGVGVGASLPRNPLAAAFTARINVWRAVTTTSKGKLVLGAISKKPVFQSAKGTYYLVSTGIKAYYALKAATKGTPVSLVGSYVKMREGVSYAERVVTGGKAVGPANPAGCSLSDSYYHVGSLPRTAVGYAGSNMFFVTVNDSTEVDAAGQVSGTQVGGGSLTELTSFLLSLGVTDAVTVDAGASTQQWAYQSPYWMRVDNLEPMIAVHSPQVGKPVTDAFLISGHVVEMPT